MIIGQLMVNDTRDTGMYNNLIESYPWFPGGTWEYNAGSSCAHLALVKEKVVSLLSVMLHFARPYNGNRIVRP